MFIKDIFFILYAISVISCVYYTNLSYLYSFYKDWLFCDFKNDSTYDFIIVGAGSAGSILAHILSNNGAEVLLVEAGGSPNFLFNVPIFAPLLINSPYDWQYITVPQKNACQGLENKASHWPAGKILGGTSRLNYMVHLQGHPEDYKSWFPDFKEPVSKYKELLNVENQKWNSKSTKAILDGIEELLYPIRNINKGAPTGFMEAQLTQKNGERWSTDRILLDKYNKERLTIMTHSFVNKVLFEGKRAIGIEFSKKTQLLRAYARNGVILSSGAIGSPKLLMLSGIGPKEHLKDLSIDPVVDLPVGKNLIDHVITGFDLVILNSSATLSIADVINPISALKYKIYREGPWTSGAVDVTGTFHSSLQKSMSEPPDLQIMTLSVGLSQDNGIMLRKQLGISDKIFNEYFKPLAYETTLTVAPILLHPKSYGEVKLKSSNPHDHPLIDPKYLSHEDDVLTLIEGIQFVKKLVKTEAMKKLGAQFYTKPLPGCENFVFDTVDYWKCYVRHLALTTYHPAGTCSMGQVVDSKFRVKGTENLFVVDASVFPKLPSGNTNAPVVMLAQKAADSFMKEFKRIRFGSGVCYKTDILLIPIQ